MKSKYDIRSKRAALEDSLTPLAQYILSEVCESKPENLAEICVGEEKLRLISGGWYEYTVSIKPIPIKKGAWL